ncbi:hypothetical protein [Roseococcus pinisoli]|uniref:HEPN domain-containing protein n=1 Tax=Roseococcus pinisoli TaxID=2835040 RepID=A0ABS5QBZ3_9PROT|nr:hypothetical protein [Roseococcus pinisoli]MBS7811195.1 hypothetical protein [Roseococcus pinisoli]
MVSEDAMEAQDQALALVVGEEAWDVAAEAYWLATQAGRPHRDALRCALIGAQKAAHFILRRRPLENAEIDA